MCLVRYEERVNDDPYNVDNNAELCSDRSGDNNYERDNGHYSGTVIV